MKNFLVRLLFLLIIALPVSYTNAFGYFVDVEPTGASDYETRFLPVYFDSFTVNDKTYSWAWAGIFNLDFYADATRAGGILFSHNAFCVEIPVPAGDGVASLEAVTGDGMTKAAWLMDSYWSSGNSKEKNAGLQLAIWEVLYPNWIRPYEVGNGYYREYLNYKQGINGADLSGFSPDLFRVVNFEAGKQDMLTVVPEPTALLLMGAGILGFAGISRRRRESKN